LALHAEQRLALEALGAAHQSVFARSQTLVATARERTGALSLQIARARRQVSASKELLQHAKAHPGWPLAVPVDACDPDVAEDRAHRTFAAVTQLIERIEQQVVHDEDALDRLIADIKAAIVSDADPCLILGVLLEGITETLLQRLPASARRDTLLAVVGMLCERLNLRSLGPD
jgi:hypothetical protein